MSTIRTPQPVAQASDGSACPSAEIHGPEPLEPRAATDDLEARPNADSLQLDESLLESNEAPPPGVRLMAVLRWGLILGMSLFALGVLADFYGVLDRIGLGSLAGKHEDAAQLYQCPMHPTYTSDRPGECPICGMTLVKVEPATSATGPDENAGHTDPAHARHLVPGLAKVRIGAERTQLIGVKTEIATRHDLSRDLDLVGYVVPDESRVAHVHSRIAGWLETLHVNETGQKVKKGDPLFTLFSRELYQAERELLLNRKASGGPVAQNSRSEVTGAARRRLELLDVPPDEIERLEKSGEPQEAVLFRSPLTGHVLAKGALEGKYVTPGDELYTVVDLSRVWVLAEVYEQHISRVTVGQKATLSVDAMPGRAFQGKIGFLYPTLSQRTRTMRVRVELDNPGLELRPGMYGKVHLELASRKVLSVPEDAVVDAGQHQYAFVALDGGHFEPRLLKTGMRGLGLIEIQSGLSEGEKVVTSAGFFIDSESRLQAAIAGLGAPAAGGHAGHGQPE